MNVGDRVRFQIEHLQRAEDRQIALLQLSDQVVPQQQVDQPARVLRKEVLRVETGNEIVAQVPAGEDRKNG